MAKSTKKNGAAHKAGSLTAKSPAIATTNASDIARRAYDLYLSRGCQHGYDVDDWLTAERELKQGTSSRI
jgi:hypothetical protein